MLQERQARPKPAYFIFLGCYKIEEDINEWYVVLARTSAQIEFYINGNRKDHPHIFINEDSNHPCFEKPSVISYRDFYVNMITAEGFLSSFENGFMEKKCNISEVELEHIKKLLLVSNDVPDFIKEIEIMEFMDFLIDINY